MALFATNRFAGDGVTTSYEFNFVGKYIARPHVKVYQEDNATKARTHVAITDSNFLNDTTLRNLPVTPAGKTLVIYRDTPKPPIVDFTNGSRFTEYNMDLVARQGLFVAMEALDAGGSDAREQLLAAIAVVTALVDDATAAVSDATAAALAAATSAVTAQDASTVATAAKAAAEAANTAAQGSASAAAGSASAASTSASNAATSASNAANSAAQAQGFRDTASTHATNAGNSATQSANSATASANSSATATTQAGIATTQAGVATTKASAASASAASAAASAASIKPMWAGNVTASGTATKLTAGWTVTRVGVGTYFLTTDFPPNPDSYSVSATCRGAVGGSVRRTMADWSGFYVETVDGAGAYADRAFGFTAILI